jgi:D-glycerate 3-kinase
MSDNWQEELLKRHRLSHSYLASAQYWFDPLVDALVEQQKAAGRPILVALNGSQGSGKSTLCAYLETAIVNKYSSRALTLSLDDFYYSHDHRQRLAREIHPLLATRGVPGTHDIPLLNTTLDALLDANRQEPVDIPRFDKATDNRQPQLQRQVAPVDIVLFEGWCLGVRPQAVEELVEPLNALEKDEDGDGTWRNYVNTELAREFVPLYRRVDQWLMLQAPDFGCVFRWRLEQEQKLARASIGKRANGIMNEAQLSRFIQFFQRLTELSQRQLPGHVDHLFVLDEARRVKSCQRRD